MYRSETINILKVTYSAYSAYSVSWITVDMIWCENISFELTYEWFNSHSHTLNNCIYLKFANIGDHNLLVTPGQVWSYEQTPKCEIEVECVWLNSCIIYKRKKNIICSYSDIITQCHSKGSIFVKVFYAGEWRVVVVMCKVWFKALYLMCILHLKGLHQWFCAALSRSWESLERNIKKRIKAKETSTFSPCSVLDPTFPIMQLTSMFTLHCQWLVNVLTCSSKIKCQTSY